MSYDPAQVTSSTRRVSQSGRASDTMPKRKSNAYMAAEAVQQERDAVRALKRLSMGGSLTIDPDLPFGVDNDLDNFQQKQQNRRRSSSGSSISSQSDDFDLNDSTLINDQDDNETDDYPNDEEEDAKLDAEKLLWVPAKSHPSIAPDRFRRHVESTLGDMHKRIHSKDKSSDSIPSLKELTDELDKLSEMAGLAATDAITLARSLSSASSSSSLLLQQNPKPRRAISASAAETVWRNNDTSPKRTLSSPQDNGQDTPDALSAQDDEEDQIFSLDEEDQDVPLFMDSSNSLRRNKWTTYSRSRRSNNIKGPRVHSPLVGENKLDGGSKNETAPEPAPEPPLKSQPQPQPESGPSYSFREQDSQQQRQIPQLQGERRPSQGHPQQQHHAQSKPQQKPVPHPQSQKHRPHYQQQQQQQPSAYHPQHRQHHSQQGPYPQPHPNPQKQQHHYPQHHGRPTQQQQHHEGQSRPQQQPRPQTQPQPQQAQVQPGSKKFYGPLRQQQKQQLPSIPRSSSEHQERPKNEHPVVRSQSDVRGGNNNTQQRPSTVQARTNHSRNRHAGSLISLDSQSSGSSVAGTVSAAPSLQKKPLPSPYDPEQQQQQQQQERAQSTASSSPSFQSKDNPLPTPPSSSSNTLQTAASNDPFVDSSETSPKKESKSKEFLNMFKMKRSPSPKSIKEQTKKNDEPLNDQENLSIPGQAQKSSPQRPGLKGSSFKFGKKEDKKTSPKKSPILSAFSYKSGDPRAQEVTHIPNGSSDTASPTTPTSQITSGTSPQSSPSNMSEDQHRLRKESLAKKLSLENMKKSNKPNAPVQFTDSAFGFPLPPLSHSTIIMLDYRFPIHVERALYRLSHLKLANPRRPLRQQVLLSNFMYSYLNLVNHTLYLQQLKEEGGAVPEEVPLEN